MPNLPIIPDNAPFNDEQRLWLNGFLAGLFSWQEKDSGGSPAAPAQPLEPLVILFGSQTGTAQNLAKRVAKEAKARGFNAQVVDASAYASVDWKALKNLFVVTSTYGDGDVPDNAQQFWAWLKSDAPVSLAHVAFSVLALGDTNYSEFCAAGKKIDARLEQLGAKRAHDRVDCDVDYEAKAKTWIEGALAALKPSGSVVTIESAGAAEPAASPAYGRNNPFAARLLQNRRLNGEGSEKETRHYEISLEGSGLSYKSGDALGIVPVNCPEVVGGVLQAIACDGEEAVKDPDGHEISLRLALSTCYEITKPSLELLQALAPYNADLAALLAPDRKEELKKWLWGRDIIDLLRQTPQARFELPQFIGLLKKIAPRLYSIASSPKAHAGQVHLTINTVRYQSFGRERKGVGSTFLADRVGQDGSVRVFRMAWLGPRAAEDSHRAVLPDAIRQKGGAHSFALAATAVANRVDGEVHLAGVGFWAGAIGQVAARSFSAGQ